MRVRRIEARQFFSVTLLVSLIYSPIVAYVLWAHFKDFTGPHWVLLFPVAAAGVSGYSDERLTIFGCAGLLTASGYGMAVAFGVVDVCTGKAGWPVIPATIVFAALWFSTAILVTTLTLVLVGRALRSLVSRNMHDRRTDVGC